MEMEAHHHVESHDTFGKVIGVQTAFLAMFLSIFSIFSHQSNTESIILVNESSNQWSHYQAKRIRDYQLELNVKLLQLLAPNNEQAAQTIAGYAEQESKYQKDLSDIKSEADNVVQEGNIAHRKTGYFEFAEGLLEISTILSSLYFLSQKKLFPKFGLLLGIAGGIIGVLGLMLH
jgi:hypothetical protein